MPVASAMAVNDQPFFSRSSTACCAQVFMGSKPMASHRESQCHPITVFHNHGRMDTLGSRIKLARQRRKMSRVQLAEKSKVPYPTLAGIENDDQTSTTQLPAIQRALEASMEWLETGVGEWDAREAIPGGQPIQQAPDSELQLALTALARVVAGTTLDAAQALEDELGALPAGRYLTVLLGVVQRERAKLKGRAPHSPAPKAQGSKKRSRAS